MTLAWFSEARGAWRPVVPKGPASSSGGSIQQGRRTICRKMGRSQMSHGNPRPIKQALAQPVFQPRLTLGVKPGGVLGHSR